MSEESKNCGCTVVSLACCDVTLRELLAGHRTAAVDAQNSARDIAAVRLDQAQAELRASERLAQVARDAAAAAVKTQEKIADCCCKTEALIRHESDRNRELILKGVIHKLEEEREQCQAQMAAYFAAKVPPVVPTC